TAKIGSSYVQNSRGRQDTKDEKGNLTESDHAHNPGHVRSVCCRLHVDLRDLLQRGGGLLGRAEVTGSLGAVSIHMARR
ncbi:ribonucleoside triphosphate reductase, partial [Aliarcobacter butzleri]